MAVDVPPHKVQHTGDALLDRIQSNVGDLIAYVRGILWMQRRVFASLATDTGNVAAAEYATVASANLTTALERGYIVIHASASGIQNTSAGTNFIQVVVDGAAVKGAYTTVTATWSWNLSLVARVAVTKGQHAIALQWKTNNATASISAKTANEDHAAFFAHEEAA